MIKKLIIGAVFVGLAGILIFGAVNRTIAKSETPLALGLNRENKSGNNIFDEETGHIGGYGHEEEGKGSDYAWENDQGNGTESGYGRGGQGRNSGIGKAGLPESEALTLATFEGMVAEITPEALFVSTADGKSIVIEGRAWRYAQEMGFALQVNEQVRITGFNEDGEFKAVEIIRTESEENFQFREGNGRPRWAGPGKGSNRYNT